MSKSSQCYRHRTADEYREELQEALYFMLNYPEVYNRYLFLSREESIVLLEEEWKRVNRE